MNPLGVLTVLNSNTDLTLLPIDVVMNFQFNKDETYKKLDPANAVQNLLRSRWQEANPQDQRRILWDLALVEAYLRPQLFELKSMKTPPENTQRRISAYTRVNVLAASADFWAAITSLTRGLPAELARTAFE